MPGGLFFKAERTSTTLGKLAAKLPQMTINKVLITSESCLPTSQYLGAMLDVQPVLPRLSPMTNITLTLEHYSTLWFRVSLIHIFSMASLSTISQQISFLDFNCGRAQAGTCMQWLHTKSHDWSQPITWFLTKCTQHWELNCWWYGNCSGNHKSNIYAIIANILMHCQYACSHWWCLAITIKRKHNHRNATRSSNRIILKYFNRILL